MPEGMTATIGPDGIRRETTFQYDYAKPPDTSGMAGIDYGAIEQNIKNQGVDAALKAAAAAIQFQGQRGYEQALKNGEPAEKAIAKFGPMMFYRAPQAFAPSVKALTPPPVKPTPPSYAWTPGTNGAPGAFVAPGKPPIVPPGTIPVIRDVKGGLYRVAPGAGTPETLIQPPKEREATPFTLTTGEGDAKLTQRLTAKENADRIAALAKGKIQPLIDEYLANEAEMKAGDFRTGLANILSRKNRNKDLAEQIKAAGLDVPVSESPAVQKAPPASPSKSPYADGTRLKGPGGKIFVVKDGKPVPE